MDSVYCSPPTAWRARVELHRKGSDPTFALPIKMELFLHVLDDSKFKMKFLKTIVYY